jgi:hypothetical protein
MSKGRPSTMKHLIFRKDPNGGEKTIRDKLYAFAHDGENVGELIERAVAAGLGSRKQITSALMFGRRRYTRSRSKFFLEEPKPFKKEDVII